MSPFITTSTTTKEKAIEIFQKITPLAIEKLHEQIVRDQVQSHDDILIFFDNILSDFAFLRYQLHSEEFKSIVSKYNLLDDPALSKTVEQIIETIVKLSPNLNGSE